MKRNIYLMYAIALLQGMVFYAPIATLYRQAAGVGIFQITLLESICMALMIALELPWGRAAERLGYRKTLLFCCGLFFVSKLVFWQAQGFGGFLLERGLLAVVCAGLSGVESALLYLSCPPGRSHQVLSRHYYLQQLGLLLAAAVYALYIGADYRLAGLLTAVSYAVAALLALGLVEVRPPEKAAARPKLRGLLASHFADRRMLYLVIAVALFEQAHQAITVFLNQLQYLRAGMSEQGIAVAYIAVSLTGLLGGCSAWLAERLGARRCSACCCAAAG